MEVIPASLAIPLDALYGMLGGAWEGGSRHCLQAVQKANLFIAHYKLSSCFHPFKDLKHLDLRIFLKGVLESYFHC